MPRLRYLLRTHFFCHDCKVVVPITYEAATEVAKHSGHDCEYTRIAT
jgi:hypothetical protein